MIISLQEFYGDRVLQKAVSVVPKKMSKIMKSKLVPGGWESTKDKSKWGQNAKGIKKYI